MRGGDIYPTDGRLFPFMYPPAAAAMLAVASVAGRTGSSGSCWRCSRPPGRQHPASVCLATGKALRQNPLLYLVPTLWVVPFIHDTYLLGQPNLLLLA